MSKDRVRRNTIFHKYSENLHLLVENGLITGVELPYNHTYLCPICLRPFSEHDLTQNIHNPLTLEDAPPKRLGGKANVLTCKDCNNTLGMQVDSHLANNFTGKDIQEFRPNTIINALFTNKKGVEVKGKLLVDAFGKLRAHHSMLNNKPGFVQAFADSITDAEESRYINMKLDIPDIDKEKLKISLLKTAYLLMFQKFGYYFLFEDVYKRVRNQFRDPDTPLYDFEDWYHYNSTEQAQGVYFVREPLMKSWLVTFELKTQHSNHHMSIFLPLFLPVQYMIMGFRNIKKEYKNSLSLKKLGKVPFSDSHKILSIMNISFESEFLSNLEQIERLKGTFDQLRNI